MGGITLRTEAVQILRCFSEHFLFCKLREHFVLNIRLCRQLLIHAAQQFI
jgi:hypothetical protein